MHKYVVKGNPQTIRFSRYHSGRGQQNPEGSLCRCKILGDILYVYRDLPEAMLWAICARVLRYNWTTCTNLHASQ